MTELTQTLERRRVQMYITGSEYVLPEPVAVPGLMADLSAWLNSDEAAALHPVERAALAHFRLMHIHPFTDGNGRTARLLMNLVLTREGYPPAVIRVEDRPAYYVRSTRHTRKTRSRLCDWWLRWWRDRWIPG